MQDRQPVALVEQLAHMNADQIIAVRVSSETKARLRALAERQQISESALLSPDNHGDANRCEAAEDRSIDDPSGRR
jgi:hypothetical protein